MKNHVIACHFLFLLLPLLLLLLRAAAQDPGAAATTNEPEISKNMAIAFVAMISAFFLLGLFSFYVRNCTEGRYGRRPGNIPADSLAGAGMLWRPARGLDPAFIATFPTFLYSAVKGLKTGKSSLECAVCLNEFESSDTLRLIPKCSHVFHSVCVDSWLVSHTTCPVCRANLVPKPADVGSPDPSTRPEGLQSPVSIVVVEETADATVRNPSQTATRSPSVWRFGGIFQRSNSTGHDRFTLRLPEEVRSQLINSTLNRTRSWAELPRVQSLRRGYRNGTGENGREKEKNLLARTLSVSIPVFGRTVASRTPPKTAEEDEEDAGERSFARLRTKGIGPSTAAV